MSGSGQGHFLEPSGCSGQVAGPQVSQRGGAGFGSARCALQEAWLLLAGLVPSGGCWGVAWHQEQAAPLPATAGTLKDLQKEVRG